VIADDRSREDIFAMKKISLSLSLLLLLSCFAWFIAPASAAKKTLEECQALAQQRGFNGGNAKMSGKPKGFIRACMSGKQQ
jgi:hypothetical protein